MAAKKKNSESIVAGFIMLFLLMTLVLTYFFYIKKRSTNVSFTKDEDDFSQDSLNLSHDWKIIGSDIQSAIEKHSLNVG